MNYTSIEDIFNSTNFTIVRNNTKYTGTDAVTAPSWLKFDGKQVNTIYVSPFCIGFDSNTARHLKVYYPDSSSNDSRDVFTEEGTFDNHRKFFSIKWRGMRNGSTNGYNTLIYMAVFWDDETISLKILSRGMDVRDKSSLTWSTGSLEYTFPSGYYATFTRQADGSYIATDGVRAFAVKKYLIRSGSSLYTIADGTLSLIEGNEPSSTLFQTYGVDSIADITLIKTLENPEVLFYTDQERFVAPVLAIKGAPTLPQIVNYNAFDISSIPTISKIQAIGSEDVLLQVSFDGGSTWHYYNSGWTVAADTSVGTSIRAFGEIPAAQWTAMATTTINFRAILPAVTSEISAIYIG